MERGPRAARGWFGRGYVKSSHPRHFSLSDTRNVAWKYRNSQECTVSRYGTAASVPHGMGDRQTGHRADPMIDVLLEQEDSVEARCPVKTDSCTVNQMVPPRRAGHTSRSRSYSLRDSLVVSCESLGGRKEGASGRSTVTALFVEGPGARTRTN